MDEEKEKEKEKTIVQRELSGECFAFVARWVGGVVEELLEHGELGAGETLAGALGGGVGRLEEEGVIGGGSETGRRCGTEEISGSTDRSHEALKRAGDGGHIIGFIRDVAWDSRRRVHDARRDAPVNDKHALGPRRALSLT